MALTLVPKMVMIAYLADHLDTIPTLAMWFRAQWPAYFADQTQADVEQDFQEDAARDGLPLRLIAFESGELAGTIVINVGSAPRPAIAGEDKPDKLSITAGSSVAMVSARDGWAMGNAMPGFFTRSTIAHWDGQAWLASPKPTGVGLSSLWMLSPQEGWAVGSGAILHDKRTTPQLYLPLILQDYWCCGQDSLVNGDFEQDDAGWRLYTSGTDWKAHDLIGSQAEGFSPYAGDYAARLGGYEGVWDTIEQTVIIPPQGRLSYWWKMGTYETLPHQDSFSVDLLLSDGTLAAHLARHDDQDLEGLWQQDRIDVSAYAGQELVLQFSSYNDHYYFSWFDFDEVMLCSP